MPAEILMMAAAAVSLCSEPQQRVEPLEPLADAADTQGKATATQLKDIQALRLPSMRGVSPALHHSPPTEDEDGGVSPGAASSIAPPEFVVQTGHGDSPTASGELASTAEVGTATNDEATDDLDAAVMVEDDFGPALHPYQLARAVPPAITSDPSANSAFAVEVLQGLASGLSPSKEAAEQARHFQLICEDEQPAAARQREHYYAPYALQHHVAGGPAVAPGVELPAGYYREYRPLSQSPLSQSAPPAPASALYYGGYSTGGGAGYSTGGGAGYTTGGGAGCNNGGGYTTGGGTGYAMQSPQREVCDGGAPSIAL